MNHVAVSGWLSLPPPLCVIAVEDSVQPDQAPVCVTVASCQRSAACPGCGRKARRVHSRYTRTITDLAIGHHPVMLHLRVCRFVCRNHHCPRRIFYERLPDLAAPYAKRTNRLRHRLQRVGPVVGGRPGARLAESEGHAVSFKTLQRYVRDMLCPGVSTPRCLGVDDWPLRKGQRYGAILYDLEAH